MSTPGGLINVISKYFKVKAVDDDSLAFKLFHRVTVGLCILCITLVLAKQYFGDPIVCQNSGKVDQKLFTAHCWVHGAHHVPKDYESQFACVSSKNSPVSINHKL